MIYKHTIEQIDAYYASPEINQSGLKIILEYGVEYFVIQGIATGEEYEEEKGHFIIGKGVDCLLTESQESFKERYYYSRLPRKPSDTAMEVLKRAMSKIPIDQEVVIDPAFYKHEVWEGMNEADYFMNRMKEVDQDTRAATLLKDTACTLYWRDLINARGKQILSEGQHSIIQMIYNSFKTHPFTAYLFDEERYQGEDYDIIYQMPLYWYEPIEGEHMRERCKALIDIIVVDHKAQSMFPIDEKTLGDFITRFPYWAKKRRYDVQGAFYTRGVKENINAISALIGKNVSNYRIQNFGFVVESTIRPGTPLKYVMTDDLLELGRIGKGKMEGWEQALHKYAIYRQYGCSVAKLTDNTRGVIWLDGEFKTNVNCI